MIKSQMIAPVGQILSNDHIVILGPTFPHEVVGFSSGMGGGFEKPKVRVDEWENREDEGVLYVPKAGEILYRLKA